MKMKVTRTLVLILLLHGGMAVAQTKEQNVKVEIRKVDIVLDSRPAVPFVDKQNKRTETSIIARVYPYRNYRVMKALHFLTRRSIPKLT
jgi:predicted aspartyl protease